MFAGKEDSHNILNNGPIRLKTAELASHERLKNFHRLIII